MYREIEFTNLFGNFYLVGAFTYILCTYSAMLYLTLINPYSNNFDLAVQILWIPLQIFFIMMIWSMIRLILSDPGKVPTYWGNYLDDQQYKKRIICMGCYNFKPERCKHCSKCQRCVLNMDHHCPWIGNCVGQQNRKFFILFLLYINLVVLFSGIILLLRLYPILIDAIFQDYTLLLNNSIAIATFLLAIIKSIFGIIIVPFFKFHLDLISTNKTTIDILKQTPTDQFDLGFKENWLSVLGTNYWVWLLPMFGERESGRPKNNGIKWEQNQENIIQTEQILANRTQTNQSQRSQIRHLSQLNA